MTPNADPKMTTPACSIVAPRASSAGNLVADPVDPGKSSLRDAGSVTLPVYAEELLIGKKEVQTGKVVVRVTPTTEERTVDVPLSSEHVEVERVPVNRVVEAVTPPRTEGDVTIIPVFKEELVVLKRLVLTEEIRLVRRRVETVDKRTVAVRTETATVERVPNEKP